MPVKHPLLLLLLAFSVVAPAQDFGDRHVQEKRLERIAIGLRVQQNLRIEAGRKEAQYAENRRRCQAALRIAELCGKHAGTFYCDEKGFRSIAADLASEPAVLDNGSRYKMERCALDAARSDR